MKRDTRPYTPATLFRIYNKRITNHRTPFFLDPSHLELTANNKAIVTPALRSMQPTNDDSGLGRHSCFNVNLSTIVIKNLSSKDSY